MVCYKREGKLGTGELRSEKHQRKADLNIIIRAWYKSIYSKFVDVGTKNS